ncbi:MAG: hypothetical protein IPF95_07015 [Flavobacteriales bacterium]|nr:hypothetical protein [Flavobacteriales bacterium]MBK6943811.1 hypothetical protein [Flavobacteriales bacterium]MBK7297070.1 hypothetical protein [Flavobacteriales bacterium]HQV50998.1 hypothetical protein [Flavobacteriales bacterium]HQZ42582.1 hypothetical protein [Flavobacteriales bacterium]
MNKLRKIVRPLMIVLSAISVVVMLGFVERTSDGTLISDLKITVIGDEGVHFIDDVGVRRQVLDQGIAVLGSPIGELDLPIIEERLRGLPCVSQAEAHHTMDGTLHVMVKQRAPVVRVFNADGTSFYIDQEGITMPIDPNYTARVLVVTGALNEPGATDGVRSVFATDSIVDRFRSDDIHRLAMFIRQDALWNALIDQVVVKNDGEFELIPKIGAQRILLGDGSELEQRFAKLKIFYEKGIPKADWRRYDRIDLRFADQVVCTKRTTP